MKVIRNEKTAYTSILHFSVNKPDTIVLDVFANAKLKIQWIYKFSDFILGKSLSMIKLVPTPKIPPPPAFPKAIEYPASQKPIIPVIESRMFLTTTSL